MRYPDLTVKKNIGTIYDCSRHMGRVHENRKSQPRTIINKIIKNKKSV